MDSTELKKYRLLVIGNSKEPTGNLPIEVSNYQSDNDSEIAELLRAIDLLVVPSKGDNSPSVISEALMCGTRVIGSNRGGIPEMLDFNFDLLFDPESPSELVNQIRNNSAQYDRRKIESHAHSVYSSKFIGQQYIDYYRELISEFSSQ
jgi:glycosyltransferase involved in cell wall biosynthesis